MRDLTELNINDGGKRVNRPAPTDAVIVEFQRTFGIVLPTDYLQLLRHSNGGHPELCSLVPEGRNDDYRCSVNHFHHLSDDRTWSESLWLAMKTWRPLLGDSALPFAEDGGGNPFFLDMSVSPPAVKRCLHDENFAIVPIARSFEAFIDALAIDPDMI